MWLGVQYSVQFECTLLYSGVVYSTVYRSGQPTKVVWSADKSEYCTVQCGWVYSTGYSSALIDCTQLYSCEVYRLCTVVHYTLEHSCPLVSCDSTV